MKKTLLGISLLCLAGCASPLEYDRSVFSISPDVKLSYIDAVSNVRDRDGQMTVQVRGEAPKTQQVYYKTEWFDPNGMKISTTLTSWKNAKLIENLEFTWNMTAPTKRATTYKVYVVKELGDGIIH